MTVTPGAAASASRAASGGTSPTNSTLMDSPWQRSTGTRTQVAATCTPSSPMIFFVSATIFHSSFVESSSRNTSMCGMVLNAMRCLNALMVSSSSGLPSRNSRVWSYSSAMAGAPAPDAAWYVETTTRVMRARS